MADGVNQTVKFYVNGVLENTTSGNNPPLLGTGPVIGTYGGNFSSLYWAAGYYDNLFVEYSAISQSEITAIASYNQ